jgi:hypothetical protein
LANVHDTDDYKLLRVGYIDKETGIITSLVPEEIDPFSVVISEVKE